PLLREEPEPGFYKAVFWDSFKIFARKQNLTPLAFIATIICFRFFNAAIDTCCCGLITYLIVWGWLLGFYFNFIRETAFDSDELPEIYLGTSLTFVWYIIQPFLIFLATIIVVQLPYIITRIIFDKAGLAVESLWPLQSTSQIILFSLFIIGLFLFPVAILTVTTAQTFALLRPDHIIIPILKAPAAYITTVLLLLLATYLEQLALRYATQPPLIAAGLLTANIAVQIPFIIAMRSIGLFFRHYGCYFKW
ncbi:MAG: hypothetical protein PHF37_10480, partial [Phycisphaerae bacterium]|nr:hypothetical protein [Phycisphaerae bacterium]